MTLVIARQALFDKASLEIPSGDMVAIFGKPGAGKSTLLHMLGCMQRPDSGDLKLEDRDITKLEDKEMAKIRDQGSCEPIDTHSGSGESGSEESSSDGYSQRDVHVVVPVDDDLFHEHLEIIVTLLGGQLVQALAEPFSPRLGPSSISRRFSVPLSSRAR